MTITDIGIRLGDFSFGILFMSQLIMTAALYKKGKAHRLQRMMFGFMLFLTLISAFEMVFFYFAQAEKSTLSSCLTDMLEMSVVSAFVKDKKISVDELKDLIDQIEKG